MTATATALHIIGITDEQTECDRCGKIELRCTVILGDDNGEVGRYGTTCASRELGIKITAHDARNAETYRRQNVCGDLRKAIQANKAGDMTAVAWWVAEARRWGIVRADEIALIAKMEGN